MGKLHEVLAVEPDIKGAADSIFNETVSVFRNKHDHFTGLVRTYHPANENELPLPEESKEMVTTVVDKLKHLEKISTRAIDIIFQKELANTEAKADLVYNGETIAEGVPATVLLNLENKLKSFKQLYQAMPTLEPGKQWDKDTHRAHTYKTPAQQTQRTTKEKDWKVIAPATDRHPAQVGEYVKERLLGTYTKVEFSGMITPVQKSEILERLDGLLGAIKQARCRANMQEAPSVTIGKKLFSIIHGW